MTRFRQASLGNDPKKHIGFSASSLASHSVVSSLNAQAIDRLQIETLASGEFIRRRDNLVIAGQSGVGKSRIVQSVGRAACVLGYRVRYTTSAELLLDLTASLADHSLPQRLRYYGTSTC